MLPLDSDAWAQLDHACGSAADVPAVLTLLGANPDDDAAHEFMYTALLRQGDAFAATFAAVPHVWSIAMGATGDGREACLSWVRHAIAGRCDPATLPSTIVADFAAWRAARQATLPAILLSPPVDLPLLLAGLAVLAPTTLVVAALLALDDDGSGRAACMHCRAEFGLRGVADQLRVYASGDIPANAPYTLATPANEPLADDVQTLIALARRAGHAGVADIMRALVGTATCPHCAARTQILG